MDENNETKDRTRKMVLILAKNNHQKKKPQKIQQTKIMNKKTSMSLGH
jgi:hypothetical protein